MESIVFSGQGLKNLDIVDVELKNKSKTLVHLDIDFNVKFNFVNLQILILDHNSLVSIKNFPVMKNLDTFSVNDNAFNSAMEFSMYCIDKFPILKLVNTLRNPMNPGYEAYDEYNKFRIIIKKIKTVQILDGLDVNDSSYTQAYKTNDSKPNLFKQADDALETVVEEIDENDINNLIKLKKRQSTITYSQRMLKKADNLTKFNRKNHSEGNKHITNNDL